MHRLPRYNGEMPLRLHPAISDALEGGATVLTPNQRAAASVRTAYDEQQRSHGVALWTAPAVLSLETWLSSVWRRQLLRGADSRILLSSLQQQVLWQEIITSDPALDSLASSHSLAEMAARAWTLLCLYQGADRLSDFARSRDSQGFERLQKTFSERCRRARFITAAELPGALARTSFEVPSEGLMLVDFDHLTPAVSSLFDSVRRANIRIVDVQTGSPHASVELRAALDETAEIQAAASWARDLVGTDPTARIAVVVPRLAEQRPMIERIFSRILAPDSLPITAASRPARFGFSLGTTLGTLPLVVTALDLLRWPSQALPLKTISSLLLSPWFGTASAAVAAFDAFELRRGRRLRPELTLAATIELVADSPQKLSLRDLLAQLRALERESTSTQIAPRHGNEAADVYRHRQGYAGWADGFRAVLDAAGWTHLSSSEIDFPQRQRWDNTLDELATLDFDGARVDATHAIGALASIAQQTIFSPRTTDAAVQIMGPLELGGTSFDALWFMGADDLSWPLPTLTNPLLPSPLQRLLRMPGSDRALDETSAAQLTARILASAGRVVVSYARNVEEGDRRPSNLLGHVEARTDCAIPVLLPVLRLVAVEDHVELPPLPATMRGGSQVLELQAKCGFRAFAEKRIGSTAPEARQPGLDAGERGSDVHRVMQSFWNDLRSQQALRALGPSEREALLTRCIDEALGRSRSDPRPGPNPAGEWEDTYLAVQAQRLRDLLLPWLQHELARPDFTVAEQESTKEMPLGPLTLDLRLDRVDLTAQGAVIVDYKTGSAATSDWLGERPDAPQLPLYAVLSQDAGLDVAGVVFALLRAGEDLAIKGFADAADVFGKPSRMAAASLEEQLDDWRRVLLSLAFAFAEGDTRVAPKAYPATCKYCSQRILCRLDVASLEDANEDDESSADTKEDFSLV